MQLVIQPTPPPAVAQPSHSRPLQVAQPCDSEQPHLQPHSQPLPSTAAARSRQQGPLAQPHLRSCSQPLPSTFKRVIQPPPSSLPTNPVSFLSRAARKNGAIKSRLDRTFRLNKYMTFLRDKCGFHFGWHGQVTPNHGNACDVADNIDCEEYTAYRRSFHFAPYTYCFHCCLPQERKFNGEQPSCHAGYAGKERCPFHGFIFKAVFALWCRGGLRGLYDGDSLPEFIDWVNKEDAEQGAYINCVEAFDWYCKALEEANPSFFL